MALGRNAKVDLIKSVPLFSRCSKKELAEVAKLADEIDFGPGKELIREGALGREFFVLVEGAVTVSRGGRKLADLGPGRSFGEMSFLDGSRATATVTARDAVVAYAVSHPTLELLLAERPALLVRFWKNLAFDLKARLVETNALVEDYADVQQVLIANPGLRESYLRG